MASLFENIRSSFNKDDGLRVRTVPVPDFTNEIGISPIEDDITNKQIYSDSSLIDSTQINKFVTLSKYRDERYLAFEEMLTDPIVAAALEMYADDATQYNRDGNIVWAESDNPTIADAANRLINILDIQSNAWRDIYSLCTYGDLYFRLYKEGDSPDNMDYSNEMSSTLTVIPSDDTRKLEERIEYVANPATVFDLQEKDKTTGFIKVKSQISADDSYINHNYIGDGMGYAVSTIQSGDCEMFYNTAFVHIMLSESIDRQPEHLAIQDPETGETSVYKIKTGKSALEDAYPATRRLNLLEDSLTLSRLAKSAVLRILQVETGDVPKAEGENILRRIKNLMEQKMSLNTANGVTRSYNNPGPIENTIYVQTHDGKGAITTNTIGGDVDIKSIADVDYFQNLKLAALKIPKQFLNFDSAEGFSNGTSLAKTSSRYAHTVMRIQTAYITGITNLLNIFFIDKGLDYVNKFKIRMVSPGTIEDSEREEQLNDKINQTRDILDLVDAAGVDEDIKNDVLVKLLKDFVGIPDIANVIDKAVDEKETSSQEDESEMRDEISNSFDELDSEF